MKVIYSRYVSKKQPCKKEKEEEEGFERKEGMAN